MRLGSKLMSHLNISAEHDITKPMLICCLATGNRVPMKSWISIMKFNGYTCKNGFLLVVIEIRCHQNLITSAEIHA
jgi:hypothetical protein